MFLDVKSRSFFAKNNSFINLSGFSCFNLKTTEDSYIEDTLFDNIDFWTVIDLYEGPQFFISNITI